MRTDDAAVREAIRSNVGYRSAYKETSYPRAVGPPTILIPGARVTPVLQPPSPQPALPPPDAGVAGRSFALTVVVAAGNRGVQTTQLLTFPFLLRRVTFSGTTTLAVAISWRLLASPDTDTTATATPSGSDLIQFNGSVIGGEDTGIHGNLNVAAVMVEPYVRWTAGPASIKLKVHNATGASHTITAYLDIDDLSLLPPL